MEQNVDCESEVGAARVPNSQPTRSMSKIVNTRSFNQNIYRLFLQKRFTQCEALIRQCPPDEFKLYVRSLMKKSNYKLQESLELLNECIVMDKLNFAYLKGIAKTYYLLGKYRSSLEAAKDAYRINSSDYQLFYVLGKISLALGDVKEATNNFKNSINKEPNEQSYLELAKMHISNHEYVQAADIIKQCCTVSEQNPETYELMGICEYKMGRNDLALQHYRQALEVDAKRYNSLMGVATVSLEKGEIQEALEMYKKAYAASNNSAVLWNNVGVAMQAKNKQVAAYSCFKRALFLDPFRWDVHANLALLLMNKHKFLPAQIHLRSAIRLSKDATLFNLLGICLSRLEDYHNAIKAFEQASKMQISNDEFKCNLLTACIKANNQVRARQVLKQLTASCENFEVRERVMALRSQVQVS